jgi:hypothetical protein
MVKGAEVPKATVHFPAAATHAVRNQEENKFRYMYNNKLVQYTIEISIYHCLFQFSYYFY